MLVTDIPGILYGTVLHRADKTLLRFLPQRACGGGVDRGICGMRNLAGQRSYARLMRHSRQRTCFP